MPKYYDVHDKAWNEYPLTVLTWADLQGDTWEGKTNTHIDKVPPKGTHSEKARPTGSYSVKARPTGSYSEKTRPAES